MRSLLVLGLLVGACSGGAAGENRAAPLEAMVPAAGATSVAQAGSISSSGSATLPAGGSADATGSAGAITSGASGSAGVSQGGTGDQSQAGGSSGTSAGTGGSGGGAPQAGTGGASGSAGSGGGSSGTGPDAAGDGGSSGDSIGGAGGEAADPCAGVAHWSPTDKITDYTPRPPDAPGDWRGDLRVFGGILWAAQAATSCQTYPGHAPGFEGWLKIATCAGGPVAETAACQCAAGSCCDGCYLRGQSYFCGETVRYVRCSPGHGGVVDSEGDYYNLFCDGLSAGDCTRWGPHTKYATGSCASGVMCQSSTAETACEP